MNQQKNQQIMNETKRIRKTLHMNHFQIQLDFFVAFSLSKINQFKRKRVHQPFLEEEKNNKKPRKKSTHLNEKKKKIDFVRKSMNLI